MDLMEKDRELPGSKRQGPSAITNMSKSQSDPYTQLLFNWDNYYTDPAEFAIYNNDKLKHPLIPNFGAGQLQWDLTENSINDLISITFPHYTQSDPTLFEQFQIDQVKLLKRLYFSNISRTFILLIFFYALFIITNSTKDYFINFFIIIAIEYFLSHRFKPALNSLGIEFERKGLKFHPSEAWFLIQGYPGIFRRYLNFLILSMFITIYEVYFFLPAILFAGIIGISFGKTNKASDFNVMAYTRLKTSDGELLIRVTPSQIIYSKVANLDSKLFFSCSTKYLEKFLANRHESTLASHIKFQIIKSRKKSSERIPLILVNFIFPILLLTFLVFFHELNNNSNPNVLFLDALFIMVYIQISYYLAGNLNSKIQIKKELANTLNFINSNTLPKDEIDNILSDNRIITENFPNEDLIILRNDKFQQYSSFLLTHDDELNILNSQEKFLKD